MHEIHVSEINPHALQFGAMYEICVLSINPHALHDVGMPAILHSILSHHIDV